MEIHGLSREAGSRSKVAVSSTQENVDPIGACIGQRGTRIQTVITELGGEKVDIIMYDEDPVTYIANALSPAKVIEIALDEDNRVAEVIVNESQLSLAIGRGGQNVRLASKLTGWRINIKDLSEVSGTVVLPEEEEEAEEAPETPPEEEVTEDQAAPEAEVIETEEEKVEEEAEEIEEGEPEEDDPSASSGQEKKEDDKDDKKDEKVEEEKKKEQKEKKEKKEDN